MLKFNKQYSNRDNIGELFVLHGVLFWIGMAAAIPAIPLPAPLPSADILCSRPPSYTVHCATVIPQ